MLGADAFFFGHAESMQGFQATGKIQPYDWCTRYVRNPTPQTPNPYTLNPEPQTLNLKS